MQEDFVYCTVLCRAMLSDVHCCWCRCSVYACDRLMDVLWKGFRLFFWICWTAC